MVEAGTWAHQRVVEGTLDTIAQLAPQAGVGSPALLVLGDVVGLRQQLGDRTALAQVTSEGGRLRSAGAVSGSGGEG